MITVQFKPLLIIIGLSLVNANAWAWLKADKTTINGSTGAATVSVGFATPVNGDLYLATPYNGQLFFFTDGGNNFTTHAAPFTANGNFAEDKVVLKLAPEGIPPNVYSLYQVVAITGKSPLDFNNWVGGMGGLSELVLQINLPAATPEPTAVPVPVAHTPEPAPTPATVYAPPPGSTCQAEKNRVLLRSSESEQESANNGCIPTPPPAPVSTATDGRKAYVQYCSSCHGSNPSANANKILNGREAGTISEAINKNQGGVMGVLRGHINSAEINAIANYLRTFQPRSNINE